MWISSRKKGSGGGGSSSMNYTTTEQVIGTWIDGKPLYQRTFNFTTTSTLNTEVVINLDTNIKPHNAFLVDGYFEYKVNNITTQYLPLNTTIPNGPIIWTVITSYPNNVTTNLKGLYLTQKLSASDWGNKNAYVTIRYTKDEDYT